MPQAQVQWVLTLVAIMARFYPTTAIDTLALAGLAAIVWAVFMFDEHRPWPSLYTLVPVAGAALILRYGLAGSVAARILSFSGLVWIGLISYSVYLWHQPLFAMARLISMKEPSDEVMLALISASIVLGYLTWRFVETPFRSKTHALYPSGRVITLTFTAFAAAFFSFGLWGSIGKGLPWRLPETVQRLAAGGAPNPYLAACQFTDGPIAHPAQGCTDFFVNDSFDVVFIGDSHLGAIFNELQAALRAESVGSYAVSMAGCIGLLGFYGVVEDGLGRCDNYNHDMINYAEQHGAQVVVIISRFTMAYKGIGYDNGEGGIERKVGRGNHYAGPGSSAIDADESTRQQKVLDGFAYEISALSKDFSVVVVYPIPEAGWDVPAMRARRALAGIEGQPLTTSIDSYRQRNGEVISIFDRLVGPRIIPVRTEPLFCNFGVMSRCRNELDGESLYSDDDHLSDSGGRLIAPAIVEAVLTALTRFQSH